MNPVFLVTHSGGFHADEVLSSCVLQRLYPQARIIRSRDPEWISAQPDRIIYDVGRDYDEERRIFDHHQRNPPLREDGSPYSSFGLIWRHYGRAYLSLMVAPEHLERIHAEVDARFVLPIDLMDNGALDPASAGPQLSDLTLPSLLESLKPVFDDPNPEAENTAFAQAMAIAAPLLEASVQRKAAKLRAEDLVLGAISAQRGSRVLELPFGMPFRSAIEAAGADELLFVIHPRETDWAITGIRKGEDSFTQRADLPLSWAGLTDAELEEACGVPGARFCHNARFIAVASTREAALRMAELAVESHLSENAAIA